ncbi:MAG: UbiA family prenyltransferase [Planctomycetes bacterium]|nr:UbiA family prenyltransferase [Planctomycetota bacterium]
MKSTKLFIYNYIKSMRLYYAFITGISGWLGVAFYQFLYPDRVNVYRSIIILIILFLSWGINQIINDYFGMKEDRINAPNRPMVNGALKIKPAMIVTGILLSITIVVSYLLNPLAVIPVIAGILLNVIYEYSKAYSLLANLVFGVMIAMCPIFGFLASGPTPEPLVTNNRLSVLALVVILNGLMTYYTYFKDYKGDKEAGKKTFVVRYGIRVARYAGIVGAFVTIFALLTIIILNWLPFGDILYKQEFIFCAAVTFFLHCWTAYLYFNYPKGRRAYFSMVTNIRACCAGYCLLISIFNGPLALYLLAASYILIGFLFDLYKDARS